MKVAFACFLSALCALCLAAAWPSPLAVDSDGDSNFVFFGRDSQHVTIAVERESAWVGARTKDGIYGWAIIADADGSARLMVRDEEGKAVNVDLLKAARFLRSLEGGQ